MKRLFTLLIFSLIFCILLAGCAPDAKNDLPSGEIAEEEQEAPGNNETTDKSEAMNDNETTDDNETSNGDNEISNGDNETSSGDQENSDVTDTPLPPVGTEAGYLFGDVTLETLDGGTINTADYRGKIVILNIWATRCPPCKEELPDFSRIASEYDGEVVIIAAHEDYTRESAPEYIETNLQGSKIIFAYDTPYGDAFFAAGGSRSIPQTAVIDPRGIIIYSGAGQLSYNALVYLIEAAK